MLFTLIYLQQLGLRKGDEHPAYTPTVCVCVCVCVCACVIRRQCYSPCRTPADNSVLYAWTRTAPAVHVPPGKLSLSTTLFQSLKTCLEARTCLENENPCLEKSGSVLQFLHAYLCSFIPFKLIVSDALRTAIKHECI